MNCPSCKEPMRKLSSSSYPEKSEHYCEECEISVPINMFDEAKKKGF